MSPSTVGSKRRCQVRIFQVSGAQVLGVRYWLSGARFQVPDA